MERTEKNLMFACNLQKQTILRGISSQSHINQHGTLFLIASSSINTAVWALIRGEMNKKGKI